MLRLLPFAISATIGLAIASACGSDSANDATPTDTTPLKVVTTIAPITSLAENIGGARIELEGIVPEGVNSHTFESPPSVVATIAEADLIVMNGLDLEGPLLELAQASKRPDAVILLLGDLVTSPEERKYGFSFPQSAGKPNPHLWLDPVFALGYATLIHEQLVELDSQNEDYYDDNFAELSARLEVLDQQTRIATQTVPPANRKLLTYHDSWVYWAVRYGFTVVAAIQPPDFTEPSAREVADLNDQIKAEKLTAIFGSEEFSSDILIQIVSGTGAEYADDLLDEDLLGDSYISMMVQNMYRMIPALGGDATPMDRVQPELVYPEAEPTTD